MGLYLAVDEDGDAILAAADYVPVEKNEDGVWVRSQFEEYDHIDSALRYPQDAEPGHVYEVTLRLVDGRTREADCRIDAIEERMRQRVEFLEQRIMEKQGVFLDAVASVKAIVLDLKEAQRILIDRVQAVETVTQLRKGE